MRKFISLTLAGLAVPMALHAQKVAATLSTTIDPGMNRAQVVATLGEPYSTRNKGSFTYLMYRNGCEKSCGMSDLVVLDSGKVVDAVFRSGERHYTGTSSSPHMITADEAAKIGGDSTKGAHPAKVRMAPPPPKANDATTGSKPAHAPKLKTAPSPAAPVVKQTGVPAKTTKDSTAHAIKSKPVAKPSVKTPAKSDTATKKPETNKPGD